MIKFALLRYYTIYMKSGNQIKFRAESIEMKNMGNEITYLSVNGQPYQHLLVRSIDLEQIEAVVAGRNSFRLRIYWG